MAKLDEETTAKKVQAVLTKKDANGEWVYTQTECRDFIVACVFELGLPITTELAGTIEKFMYAIGTHEDMDDDAIIEKVFDYFRENPLNPCHLGRARVVRAGRALHKGHEGYKAVSEQLRALRAAGKTDGIKAPEEDSPKVEVKGQIKRGLSK